MYEGINSAGIVDNSDLFVEEVYPIPVIREPSGLAAFENHDTPWVTISAIGRFPNTSWCADPDMDPSLAPFSPVPYGYELPTKPVKLGKNELFMKSIEKLSVSERRSILMSKISPVPLKRRRNGRREAPYGAITEQKRKIIMWFIYKSPHKFFLEKRDMEMIARLTGLSMDKIDDWLFWYRELQLLNAASASKGESASGSARK